MQKLLTGILLWFPFFVHAQILELEFPEKNSPDSSKVQVCFSPIINTSNGSHIILTIDSIVQGKNKTLELWKLNFIIHIKTTSGDLYSKQIFLYPFKTVWDTLIQSKIISLDIQPIYASAAHDSLIALSIKTENIVNALNKINFNDTNLTCVQKTLFNLSTLKPSDFQQSIINNWVSNKFVVLAQLLIQKQSPEAAITFLKKALEFNPNNANAAVELAKFYYKTHQFDLAYKFLKIAAISGSDSIFTQATELAQKIFDFYMQMAKNQDDTYQCFLYATKADSLNMLYMINPDSLENVLQKTVPKIFQQKADTLLNSYCPSLDLCLQNYYNLLEFFHNHSEYIDTQNFFVVSSQFEKKFISKIDSLIAKNQFKKAIHFLNSYQALCDSLAHICSKSHNPLILNAKIKIYNSKIRQAQSYLQNKKLLKAQQTLQWAEKFRANNNIDTSELWRKINSQTQKAIAQQKLDSINALLKSKKYLSALSSLNRLDSTNRLFINDDTIIKLKKTIIRNWLLDTIASLNSLDSQTIFFIDKTIIKYDLENDQELLKQYHQKLKGLLAIPCIDWHYKFFKVFATAKELNKNKQYLAARDSLEKFVQRQPTCLINYDTIEKFIITFKAPIIYQKLIDSFYLQIDSNNYSKALNYLLKAEKYFHQHHIRQYGLQELDLYKIITSQSNDFIFFSAVKMIQLDSLNLAFRLTEYLRQKGIPAIKTAHLQKALGYKLALYDFTTHPEQSPLQSVERYTAGKHFWYRFLSLAYIKQRKKMKYFKF